MSRAVKEATVSGECTVHAPVAPTKTEARTRWVVGVTAVTMMVEIAVGWATGSLALLADGWHMATHVGALGLSAAAYWYARTRAHQREFAFGTGKVYALAGYTSAGLLLAAAIGMAWAAVERFVAPQSIHFDEALPVAVAGLVINLVCAWLLATGPDAHAGHSHAHDHGDDHDHDHAGHDHAHDQPQSDPAHRAAYLHVVADALTSVLAIVALGTGKGLGWTWADPAVALLGAAMITRWSLGLIRESARQLVDLDPSTQSRERIRAALEALPGTHVDDLHLWRVGPARWVCVVAVATDAPRALDDYRAAIRKAVPVEHVTVEVRGRPTQAGATA
jgi:cation diffusion facilitator family transporter